MAEATASVPTENCDNAVPSVEESTAQATNGVVSQTDGTENVVDTGAQGDTANQEEMVVDETAHGVEEEEAGDPKSTEEDGEHYAVLVMNIPETVTEDDLKKHLEEDIAVKTVTFLYGPDGKFHGYATVVLPNKWAYEASLTVLGTPLKSRYLYVVPHKSMSNPREITKEIRLYRILVSNISKSVGLREAKRHFFPAGLIRRFIPVFEGSSRRRSGKFSNNWSATIRVNKLETFSNILEMDGLMLGDQPIKVEPIIADIEGVFKPLVEAYPVEEEKSEEQKQKAGTEDRPNEEYLHKVFVGNLPPKADAAQIIEHLSQAGKVVTCWMPDEYSSRKRPKIAFVTMADEEAYKKALELKGSKMDGHELNIRQFLVGKKKDTRLKADPEWLKKPNIVVITNLPDNTTEDNLKKYFEDVGEIVSIRYPKDKKVHAAYMEFGDQEACEKAINMSNTYLGEHCITVVPTTSKLVPPHWLGISQPPAKSTPQKGGPKKNNKSSEPEVDSSESSRVSKIAARRLRRKIARRNKRKQEREVSNPPPEKKMKGSPRNQNQNQRRGGKRGGLNFGAYNPYATANVGFGGGLYNQVWKNDFLPSNFHKPRATLEESKKKEIQQVALAALTELEARKSGMGGNYFAGSSSGNSYAYGSKSSSSYYY